MAAMVSVPLLALEHGRLTLFRGAPLLTGMRGTSIIFAGPMMAFSAADKGLDHQMLVQQHLSLPVHCLYTDAHNNHLA